MIDVMSLDDPCGTSLNTLVIVAGTKAVYDTFNGSQTKEIKSSQQVALGAVVAHSLLKVAGIEGLAPQLLCAVAYIAALYMGNKICDKHKHLANDLQLTTSLAVVLFGAALQTECLAPIAYALPVLVAGYRANFYEYAKEDVKEDIKLSAPAEYCQAPEQVAEPAEESPEPEAVEEIVEKIETTVDTEPIQSASEESGTESSLSESGIPNMEPTKRPSFEELMAQKLGKLRMANNKVDKNVQHAEDDNQRNNIIKDKQRDQAFSGEYNGTKDTNNATRKRNVEDSLKNHAKQQSAHEAYQNKMDAAHQVTAPEPLGPTRPSGSMSVQRGFVNREMKPSMDWKATGTSTSLKPMKSVGSQVFSSPLDKLRAMKKLQKMGKDLKRMARNKDCPGEKKPTLKQADAVPATHSNLPIEKSTQAIGRELDLKTMIPSLNRAVATPDQDALQSPETAKFSDGLITIRSRVLYQAMGAMLKESEDENKMLRAQVDCCKTIITRLRTQITNRKRETAITKVVAFMDHYAHETEQKLHEQRLAGIEKPEEEPAVEEPAVESLQGKWTVLHYDGDIEMSLDQEEDGMVTGDAGDFLENVTGKYDKETRGLCMRVDYGTDAFQLVQGEMVSGFGIVMLRNFQNGVELPCEFCIMAKDEDQSGVVTLEELDAMSDEDENGGTDPDADINVQTT